MAVSRRLRFEILRRDNHTCRYCGASSPDAKLTVDHVTPVALGGRDEPANLVTACHSCNAGKSSVSPDSPIVADVDADALRWAKAREHAIQQWRADRAVLAFDLDVFAEKWDQWGHGEGDSRRLVPKADGWEDSVERWIEEGLDAEDLVRLIPKAMRKKDVALSERWRYFCGVVWRTLDDLGKATTARLDESQDIGGTDVEDDAQEQINDAFIRGFKHALGLVIEWGQEASGSTSCIDCSESRAYGSTQRCLPCWRDSLEPVAPAKDGD